jgi:mono/diheme cytochrome c family protein
MRGRALILALLMPLLLGACETMSQYSVRPSTYSGVRLYQTFCASCHGLTGHGDGPVQPILGAGVPDLAQIAARHGGQFPRDEIRQIIDGRTEYAAHGSRKMPVWGFEFYGDASNEATARGEAAETIDRLVKYLETLQPGYYQ